MNRRELLRGIGGILAAGVAPAFAGSSILMPVKPLFVRGATDTTIWTRGLQVGDLIMVSGSSGFDGRFMVVGTVDGLLHEVRRVG